MVKFNRGWFPVDAHTLLHPALPFSRLQNSRVTGVECSASGKLLLFVVQVSECPNMKTKHNSEWDFDDEQISEPEKEIHSWDKWVSRFKLQASSLQPPASGMTPLH